MPLPQKYLVKTELRDEITHTGLRMPISGEVVSCLAEVRREEVSVEKAGIFPAGPPCEDPYRPQPVPGMFYGEPIPDKLSVASLLIEDRTEIERICQTPEATQLASEPLDLKKDLVTYADHQIFSTELERRLDDLGLVQHDPEEQKRPGMKAHLEFGTWMVPHRRILHTPKVSVKPSQISLKEQPKDFGPAYAIDHVDKYFQQKCNPLPRALPGLDLATQEALFYNGGQKFPRTVDEGVEVKTFSEVTISESAPIYDAQEIASFGPDTISPMLECPMHFFGKPDGDFTGTVIQVRSPGEYHTDAGTVWMEAGTFKVHRTREEALIAKHKKAAAKHREAKVWFEKVQGYDMTEVLRLRISRQVRNSIQYNLNSAQRFKRYGVLPNPGEPAEQKARDTLRDMISESDWRRYVTNGFIMVRGSSGKWYQIFRGGQGSIRIYQNGALFGSVCIHTLDCPPTDHVIAMKLLVELDEDAIVAEGNFTLHRQNNVWDETIRQAIDSAVPSPNLIETVKVLRHGMVI